MANKNRIRVVQWSTGNVGAETARAILANPLLELVGCYAFAPEKAGADVGLLIGEPATGVIATADVDALLALRPDCLCYNPVWGNAAELCRFLAAGINVVTSSHMITGSLVYGRTQRAELQAACEAGGSSLFGSGMHPGFSNLMALATSSACSRIDKISILESQDASGYASAETQRSVGFDHPIDSPDLESMVRDGSQVFAEGLEMMADALNVTLDSVSFAADFAPATADADLGFMTIREGHVAGVEGHWLGHSGGQLIFDVGFKWVMGPHVRQPWPIDHAYLLRIDGMPTLKLRLEIRPPADFVASSLQDYMRLGMVLTGLPVVNAIPAVCAATPGIKTYADLPVTAAAGFVNTAG